MGDPKPSSTAQIVALGAILASYDPEYGSLVPSEAIGITTKLLAESSTWARLTSNALRFPVARKVGSLVERLTIPGMSLHYLLRKKAIEDFVRECLAAGSKQVVIFGAGFDTLALRLHREFPEVLFVEIDHPATQACKRAAIEKHGLAGANLHFISADLAHELETGIENMPTIGVAEGLFMYLPQTTVQDLLSALADQTNLGRLIFTFMDLQTNGKPGFKRSAPWVDWFLKLRGEPFLWGLDPKDIVAFLEPLGLSEVQILQSRNLQRRYLRSISADVSAAGEVMCVAKPSR